MSRAVLRVETDPDLPGTTRLIRGAFGLLEPGMTFALEPEMVFKNRFSAGVESVFTVTETGHRLISQVPVEVFVC